MTMNVQYSSSLLLIWQVAEYEARQLKASTIEPNHLLLGLTKSVDLDLKTLVSKEASHCDDLLEECLREVRRLRNVFRSANLNAAIFRRRLRRVSDPHRLNFAQSEHLHSSAAAKRIFSDAEHLTQLTDIYVYPIHLLFSVLATKDEQRDEVLKGLGIDNKLLFKALNQELIFAPSIMQTTKNEEARWN